MKRRLGKVLVVIAAVIAALVAVYLVALLRKPLVDDEARRERAPESSFAELSAGVAEYQLAGPEDGEPVVLVAGFSVPFFCWDPVFEGLADSGFRVLRYNHYGRGYSESVRGRYTPELFERQLLDMIEAADMEGAVDLIGLSMGGTIAVHFANRHPEFVSSLCLISPAGFPIPESFTTKLVKVPIVGDLLYALVSDSVLKGRNADNLFRFSDYPEFQTRFEEQFAFRGINQALLSTLRFMPFSDMPEEYARLGESAVPVCLIWGDQDAVIPFANSGLVLQAVPRAEFHPIPGAGHNSQYEAAETVVPILVGFLRGE